MALTATLQPPTLPRWSRSQLAHLKGDRSGCCSHARHSSFNGTQLMRALQRCTQQPARQCRAAVKAAATGEGNSAPGSKTTRIHKLVEEKGVLLMPGCYDALSARILQKSGFNAGFISGYAMSAAFLGKPDFGLLTPPEMASNARHICAAATDIPIIADADTGGGNALNVERTVKDLIAAGAAGCFLEDQQWPKKCGHMRGKQVIPMEEHAQKIAAARDAIGDADFFLVARTDARATSKMYGLQDAIARANLYMEAGADASFVEAPRDDDELRLIGRQTQGLRVCNMLEGGVTPLHPPEELADMGFQIIVHPLTGLYAASRALLDIYDELHRRGTTKWSLRKLATFEEFNQIVDLEELFQKEAKYGAKEPTEPYYSNVDSKGV